MFKKLLVITLLLSVSSHTFAQLEQLIQMGAMPSNVQPTTMSTDEEQDDSNTQSKDERKDFDSVKLLGSDFGYIGEESFDVDQKNKQFNEPLEYFGYSFFLNPPSTFALNEEIYLSDQYLIGPGDKFKIMLYGTRNQDFSLEVSRDGDIFFPELGSIYVANLTFQEAKEVITKIINDNILGTEAKISLSDFRSISIFVLGEVESPGVYKISSLSTLINAIISSGGIKTSGSLRNIQLKRGDQVLKTFDLYDLLLNGNTSGDEKLLPGDVIFVPPISKMVAVYGEVNRPSIYELHNDENLGDLIRYAGNLKPKANSSSVEVITVRNKSNGFEMSIVDLNDSSSNQYSLKTGDVIRIYPVNDDVRNAILFKGHAKNPGFAPLGPTKNKISDFLGDQDDLLTMTDIDYVLIKRKDEDSKNFKFLQVNLRSIFTDPESSENISLMEKDEVILFPKLLTQDAITTRLIQDEYTVIDNKTLPVENEWDTPTYLRKSMLEDQLRIEEQNDINQSAGIKLTDPREMADVRRYYEYTVHNYCYVPESFVKKIIQSTGFDIEKSIPISQLKGINNPIQFESMINQIENEIYQKEASLSYLEKDTVSAELTSICRKQILDPIMDLIEQQRTDSNSNKTISVFGNVRFPGDYPLTNKMQLEDSVLASGGFKEATYNAEIELTRRDVTGKTAQFTNKLLSSLRNSDMKTELSAGDTITIKQIKKDVKTVEVSGEVYFSGTYPITEYQTLKELLTRSGGLTKFAFAKGAVFQRQALKESEIKSFSDAQDELRRKILLSSTSGGLGEKSLDTDGIQQLTSLVGSEEMTEKDALGRLVVDLEGILSGEVEDIVLEDGDKIHIPRLQRTVTVIGEVFAPNAHFFSDDLSLDDYLKKSGGLNEYADRDNIYLIKSNGSIISPSDLGGSGFFRTSNSLEPGDTVVVPLMVTPFSTIKATTEITQIIYQMALAAAAINSFSN